MRARYANDLRKEPGKVALVTDRKMAKHRNMDEPSHPERPERILVQLVWTVLSERHK